MIIKTNINKKCISLIISLAMVLSSVCFGFEAYATDGGNLKSPAPANNNIYLNGQKGDDEKDGLTPESALKTFNKAKEIATNNKCENIIVTGTVDVEGDVSLENTNAKLLRSKDFNGYLLKVPNEKTATLKSITIDGNSGNNKNIENSLVQVHEKATLNIETAAILKNNEIKAIENTATRGGAVDARYGSTVNMTDGIIEKNQATYGGGIYLQGSTLNFSGGEVRKNSSDLVDDKAYKQLYSAGAGILAYEGSTIYMSGSAKVSKNSAAEVGGGISVGSNQAGAACILNMTGGTIDGNTAGASGGGIFIQAGLRRGAQSMAHISAGKIINNIMDGKGKTNKAFGGGGIYVNGIAEKWEWQGHTYSGVNGELYLTNALITNNTSKKQGAGMACCPIAKTKIYVNNGVALYGNKSMEKNVGKELFLYSRKNFSFHGGESEYKLSKLMLGGAPYNWMLDNDTPLPYDKYEGKLSVPEEKEDSNLSLNVNSKGNNLTNALTKVVISGNESDTLGGGIGSNGNVVFGTSDETTEVSVVKKWKDNGDKDKVRPKSIKVNLIAKLKDGKEYIVEERELSEKNNWKTTFKDLPTVDGENQITYTVKEEKVEGYEGKITGNQEDGFVITNSIEPNTPKTPEKISVEGSKTWNDADNKDGKRPDEITIYLLKNGVKIASKKVTEADGWKWKFENLDKYENKKEIIYSISEEKVEGYTTEIKGYDVVNSYTPEKTKTVKNKPKTWDKPDMLPYSVILLVAAFSLVLINHKRKKRA